MADVQDPDVQKEEKFEVLPARSVHNRFSDFTIPQNPWLADNNFSSGHQDSWCSESVGISGPTRGTLTMIRKKNPYGYMPIMGTNREGQMIGMCVLDGVLRLVVYDEDCNIISATETGTAFGSKTFAGGYFYLDDNDDAVCVANGKIKCLPTNDVRDDCSSIIALEFKWVSDSIVDLVCEALDQDNTKNTLYSNLPDWILMDKDDHNQKERYFWCLMAGQFNAKTGIIETEASIAYVKLDTSKANGENTTLVDVFKCESQWNNNTFSVTADGAIFVTNGSKENEFKSYIWKVQLEDDKIKVIWQTEYQNCGVLKVGQTNIGSGTTPTIMDDGKHVAITDNANPYLNVAIFDIVTGALVSETPVFSKMRGGCEASVIGVGKYVVVENNFGHTVRPGQSQYVANEPGMAMIKLSDEEESDGKKKSEVIWEDNHCYLAMNMLARKSGIIYATTMDWSGAESAREGPMYYMCAKDSYDGRVIWRIPIGRGYKFCHDYGGIYFNRNGDRLYVGTQEYIICIK